MDANPKAERQAGKSLGPQLILCSIGAPCHVQRCVVKGLRFTSAATKSVQFRFAQVPVELGVRVMAMWQLERTNAIACRTSASRQAWFVVCTASTPGDSRESIAHS